jgi:hypothetical protein
MCEDTILGHTLSLAVHETEIELRFCAPLFSGSPKPLRRFPVVLGDTMLHRAHETEVELRVCDPLFSSQPKPLQRFPGGAYDEDKADASSAAHH